ncbi:MAG: hypothetical protein J5997_03385, partial [Oscillospiraceae bacterium]|nr:hypothetical protein [Oscillospiraceae bacterium]
TDMIEVGVYAIDEDNTELVFSMFTEPSGTPMASLFVYNPDGSGDVICGSYTTETETDENGITWTLLTGSDVYTEQTFEIGFAETEDGQVFILNTAGAVYEGQYLTADETVVYMGTPIETGYLRSEMPILRCLSKRASQLYVVLFCYMIIITSTSIGYKYQY